MAGRQPAAPKPPTGLQSGGATLWREVVADHELECVQLVTLHEACRAKDRLDEFDSIIHGKGVLNLMRFRLHESWDEEGDRTVLVEVKFDSVIANANATANLMKQLLAALRLPDAKTGARPQQRGGARGAYQSGGTGGGSLGNLQAIAGGKS